MLLFRKDSTATFMPVCRPDSTNFTVPNSDMIFIVITDQYLSPNTNL